MQVYEAMTPEVVSALPDTTLMDAAQTMRNMDIGLLPVVDGGRPVGMMTDRDITVRATAEGLDPKLTPVRDVMTPEVTACRADDDVREAARLMQEAQLRRLLVIDQAGYLVGVVSIGDLALQTGDDTLTGQTLEKVSEPAVPRG